MNKFGIVIFLLGALLSGGFMLAMNQVPYSESAYASGTISEETEYSESYDSYYTCTADLVVDYPVASSSQIYKARVKATMESSSSCIDIIENYYPVGDRIDVYYYTDAPEVYSFNELDSGEASFYGCCTVVFGLLAIAGLVITFSTSKANSSSLTGGLRGRAASGASTGSGHTGGLSGRNEALSLQSQQPILTNPYFSGPHNGKFLAGQNTRSGNKRFKTFEQAVTACLQDPNAGGITMEGPEHFTVRRQDNLLNSSSGEISWVRTGGDASDATPYNSSLAPHQTRSTPTSPPRSLRTGEHNYNSVIHRLGLRTVPQGEIRFKLMSSGMMTAAMADKFLQNNFVIQTLGLEQTAPQATPAPSVIQSPTGNFWDSQTTNIPANTVEEDICGHIQCSEKVNSFDFRCFECRKRFCDEHRGATFKCQTCS